MAGLRKAKKYDWKDSNMALFGSDLERKVKKESAMCEPAWEGAGTEVGLKIWRVVQFEIKDWPREQYGQFFDGDSYIILNTYKKNPDSEELCYDLHFWIGKHSTQDEYGTAAYKTVELDTFLDDKAVQHREVMGHESPLFKSYFSTITCMQGGADTGFNRVTPEEYRPRLLRVCRGLAAGKKITEVKEVPYLQSSLNPGDVFILDLGLLVYQMNGADCDGFERSKAATYVQELESQRPNCTIEVLDGHDGNSRENRKFYEAIPEGECDEVDSDDEDEQSNQENTLLRLSDASGSMQFTEVKKGDVTMDDLGEDDSDVFIFDCKCELFVWCGELASVDEKRNGMGYAHQYLMDKAKHYKPVSVVSARNGKDRIEVALTA